MGVASSSHACGPAPFDPSPGSVLAARYFKSTSNGLLIHHKTWSPVASAQAAVYLVHGLAEHSARYELLGQSLAKEGFLVHALDLMGHGASEGDRAYISSVDEVVADILQLVKLFEHPGLPRVLFGHSMGGLFALRTAQAAPAGTFDALVLSGPALMVDPGVDNAFNRFLARMLSSILPKLPVQPLDARMLCTDEAICQQYRRDPLCYQGSIRVRTGYEVMNAIAAAKEAAKTMTGPPLLIVHGAGDQLCRVDGSRELMRLATGIADKTLIEYPGYLHEILQEKEGAVKVGGDITAWVAKHVGAAK